MHKVHRLDIVRPDGLCPILSQLRFHTPFQRLVPQLHTHDPVKVVSFLDAVVPALAIRATCTRRYPYRMRVSQISLIRACHMLPDPCCGTGSGRLSTQTAGPRLPGCLDRWRTHDARCGSRPPSLRTSRGQVHEAVTASELSPDDVRSRLHSDRWRSHAHHFAVQRQVRNDPLESRFVVLKQLQPAHLVRQ